MDMKILMIFCIFIFVACGRGRDEVEYVRVPRPAYEPRMVYVALGDSVSEGFGLWEAAGRHTTLFFERLRDEGVVNEYLNLAVSGHTTGDLLGLLGGLGRSERESLRYAQVVSLNIGGNNLLAPLWAYLPNAGEVQGIFDETMALVSEGWELVLELLDFIDEASDVIEDVLDVANELVYFADNFGIFDIFRVNSVLASATPAVDGATEIFGEFNALQTAVSGLLERSGELAVVDLFALIRGNFSAELEADFQAALRLFEYEFVQILDWLTENAPRATIIVNTVYNPIPLQFMGFPVNFAHEARRFVHELNHIIYVESSARELVVSDVYAALSGRLDLMIASVDIIHPNPAGHEIIANLAFDDLVERSSP
jgi:lysophospholipase L1-like esterase